MYIGIPMYIGMYVHRNTYVYGMYIGCVYVYINIHICVFIYIYIYMHLYSHIYIHTHTRIEREILLS